MPTLGDMRAEIADDLARSDLTDQISRAITSAIRRYQSERFTFSEGTFTFQTVAGQNLYGAAANANIPTIRSFDTVMVTAPVQPYVVCKARSDQLERWDTIVAPTQPELYSYFGETLRLYPVPDAVYTIRVAGHLQAAAPVADGDSSFWTNEAYDLIAARAKWRLATHVLQDDVLANRMQGPLADALNDLKGRLARVSSTGQVQGYNL